MNLSTINNYNSFDLESFIIERIIDGNTILIDECKQFAPNYPLYSKCMDIALSSDRYDLLLYLLENKFTNQNQIIEKLLPHKCYKSFYYFLWISEEINLKSSTIQELFKLSNEMIYTYLNLFKKVHISCQESLLQEIFNHDQKQIWLDVLHKKKIINHSTYYKKHKLLNHFIYLNDIYNLEKFVDDSFQFDEDDYSIFTLSSNKKINQTLYSFLKFNMEKEYVQRKGIII